MIKEHIMARKPSTPPLIGRLNAPEALSGMEPARRAAVAKRMAQMPVKCRGAYLRAVRGKARPAAVKVFCLECVCWVREEVAHCTALACPLWSYRPYQKD